MATTDMGKGRFYHSWRTLFAFRLIVATLLLFFAACSRAETGAAGIVVGPTPLATQRAADEAAEEAIERATEKAVERVAEKVAQKAAEKVVEHAAEKAGKAAEEAVGRAVAKATGQAVDTAAHRQATEVVEKAAERAVEKAAEVSTAKEELKAKRPDEWWGPTKVHFRIFVLDIDAIDDANQSFMGNVFVLCCAGVTAAWPTRKGPPARCLWRRSGIRN